jgi:hypothetical protein
MLTWCEKRNLDMGAKTRWQLKLHVFSMEEYQTSWKVNKGPCANLNWMAQAQQNCHVRKGQKTNNQKSPWSYLVYMTTYTKVFFSIFHFHQFAVYIRLHLISHFVWEFFFQMKIFVHSGIAWSLDYVLFFLCVWHVLKTWCLWRK